MAIHRNPVSFFGIREKSDWIAVISGFATDLDHYRCRGLWVAPSHRGQGLAHRLFDRVARQALEERRTLLWSLPRQQSFSSYAKFGFVQRSDWFMEGMDFGPNCYACVDLSSRSSVADIQTRLKA